MVMQIGLLGKANVGKSTLFSAATETPVQIGNFPFTTIEPNVGVTHVKTDCACKHFKIKHENQFCVNGTRFIPINLIDIAGLVPGAHEGKGLGNQFLDDARQAEALIHVLVCPQEEAPEGVETLYGVTSSFHADEPKPPEGEGLGG